jgi:integrase
MPKYCSENERVKRAYTFYLEATSGKQSATIETALRAVSRFEESTGFRPFSKFTVEQARSFRARLADEPGPSGKPLSAATISTTLKQLRNFFLWLSREPGYRSKLNPNDAQYFNPSEQDRRIAGARRQGPIPTLEEIKLVLRAMPAATPIERRDRAVVAFAILSGARDGAMVTFRLKHLDLRARTVFQDGREVKTKRRKTFTSCFFPVGPEPPEIVSDYVSMLTFELGFGPDDPLFPATQIGQSSDRGFAAMGLSRQSWSSAAPIRKVFRSAFASVGLPYANPHSYRKTLARLGERLCRTPEEWKAWSQNLGHESEATTFIGYGEVPSDRQREIMVALASERSHLDVRGLDIKALEAFLQSAKAAVPK